MKVVFPIDLVSLDFWKNIPFLFSEKILISTFVLASLLVRDLESSRSFKECFDVSLLSRYNALRTFFFSSMDS